MAGNPSAGAAMARSAGPDDFKMIRGIGPGIESRLVRAGIRTFDQLAASTPEDIGALVADIIGMTSDRIRAQDWIGQARGLVAGRPVPAGPAERDAAGNGRQHYASFTLELLLDETNDVRRTRLTHVQNGLNEMWPGWDAARLVDVIVRVAGLRVERVGHQNKVAPIPADPLPEATKAAAPAAPANATARARARLIGEMCVRELSAWPSGAATAHFLLHAGQPFGVRLALDLSAVVSTLPDATVNCVVTVHARSLSGRERRMVGQAKRTVTLPAQEVILVFEEASLDADTYRLEAEVQLILQLGPDQKPVMLAQVLRGSPISVY